MNKSCIAYRIGSTFGTNGQPDGQCRLDSAGRNMMEVCREEQCSVEYPNGRGVSPIVYEFDDGSAIVEADGAWDFRAEGCTEHCWDGAGCDCAQRAEQAEIEAARSEVLDLIDQSVRHDEIVHADWTQALENELIALCDDSVDTGDEYQFWGENEDGDDWRIHLDKAGEA